MNFEVINMDIFGINHAMNWINSCHIKLPCGGFVVQVSVLSSFSQVLVDFAVILVLFCPHLDSFIVLLWCGVIIMYIVIMWIALRHVEKSSFCGLDGSSAAGLSFLVCNMIPTDDIPFIYDNGLNLSTF